MTDSSAILSQWEWFYCQIFDYKPNISWPTVEGKKGKTINNKAFENKTSN